MLDIIGFIFVFCLVLFIYLHVYYHLKTSNDLEIYEIDQVNKLRMEDIFDLRQPVLLDNDEDLTKIVQTTNKTYLSELYPAFELKIRNKNSSDYVVLPFHETLKLFEDDKDAKYFSENNTDFLNETGAIKNLKYNDSFYRPSLVSNCNYDILLGSENTVTPFRYDLNYRNFYLVTQGSIKIKLTPPKSSKYLYPIYDYENFEFRSPINPWDVEKKYYADFDKIKCLEITLEPGKLLYIPAYWWYSIKFGPNTSVTNLAYRTYMNNIAITPYIGMYMLQNQNIKRNFAKKIDLNMESQPSVNTDKNATEGTTPIQSID
jgi:Cupin-like domain